MTNNIVVVIVVSVPSIGYVINRWRAATITRDLTEIHMLLALYGHMIDERDWPAMDQVFTDDIVYDATLAITVVCTRS